MQKRGKTSCKKHGTRFYNYYVSGGTMFDDLHNLKFILNQGGTVEYIYMQIDIPEMLSNYRYSSDNYLFRYSPYLLNESTWRYKLSYLTIFPYMNVVGKIKQNIANDFEYARVDYFNSGCWYRDAKEYAMAKNSQAYIAREQSFHTGVTNNVQNHYLYDNLQNIKEIISLCETNNITVILFVTPHNHKLMDSVLSEDYIKVLQLLASVHDYWDFSGYNTVTLDNGNYYETSHYRPNIGALIAAKIFGDSSISVPSDFGFFVTNNNIEQYLSRKKNEIMRHRLVQK